MKKRVKRSRGKRVSKDLEAKERNVKGGFVTAIGRALVPQGPPIKAVPDGPPIRQF